MSNFAKHFCRGQNVDSNTQTQPDSIYCSSMESQQKSSQEFLIWQSFCRVECLERGLHTLSLESLAAALNEDSVGRTVLKTWIQWHFALKHCLPPSLELLVEL